MVRLVNSRPLSDLQNRRGLKSQEDLNHVHGDMAGFFPGLDSQLDELS